jgi:Fic family protein
MDKSLLNIDSSIIMPLEAKFHQRAEEITHLLQQLEDEKRKDLSARLLCIETVNSASIEGKSLDQGNVHISIRRHLGLVTEDNEILPQEKREADLICTIYDTFDQPLTFEMLTDWHALLFDKRGEESPSSETKTFLAWFNKGAESVLVRAAMTALCFEQLHYFEQGNDQIARALIEKALSQDMKRPSLVSLSHAIVKNKKAYVKNRSDVEKRFCFLAEMIVQGQEETVRLLKYFISNDAGISLNRLDELSWMGGFAPGFLTYRELRRKGD